MIALSPYNLHANTCPYVDNQTSQPMQTTCPYVDSQTSQPLQTMCPYMDSQTSQPLQTMCSYVDSQTSQPMQWRARMWTVRCSINSHPSPQVGVFSRQLCLLHNWILEWTTSQIRYWPVHSISTIYFTMLDIWIYTYKNKDISI